MGLQIAYQLNCIMTYHLPICTLPEQQIMVIPSLHNPGAVTNSAFAKDEDDVRFLDGGQAVCNRDDGHISLSGEAFNSLLHEPLRLRV